MDIWPFSKIRQLQREVHRLEGALSRAEEKNESTKSNAGLRGCPYELCSACAHAIWADNILAPAFLVGCDKAVSCPDFENVSRDRFRESGLAI